MRILIDTEKDYYKISGSLDDDLLKDLSEKFKLEDKKRNSVLISQDYDPIEVYETVLNGLDIEISFNFNSINDFIGEETLTSLFKIAYSDRDFTSDYISKLQSQIIEKSKRLNKNASYDYPDVILSDSFFQMCLDELSAQFSKSRVRLNVDWSFYYRQLTDKTGTRESLREIAKTLFMINFANSVSRDYVSAILSKFNLKPMERSYYSTVGNSTGNELINRLRVLAELERLNKPESKKKLPSNLRDLYLHLSGMGKSKKKSSNLRFKIKNGLVLEDTDSDTSSSESD